MDRGVDREEVDEVLFRADLDDHLISYTSGNPLVFWFHFEREVSCGFV
jgi:hypothetical protein